MLKYRILHCFNKHLFDQLWPRYFTIWCILCLTADDDCRHSRLILLTHPKLMIY